MNYFYEILILIYMKTTMKKRDKFFNFLIFIEKCFKFKFFELFLNILIN